MLERRRRWMEGGTLVDAALVEARVQKLEELVERLDEVRKAGEAAYLADEQLRAATERWLQGAIRICIDLGTQLITERTARPPSNNPEVFEILGERGVIPSDLVHRLAGAARQHDLIMHEYMEIDDRSVFASLAHLDDLREFAASAERLADSDA